MYKMGERINGTLRYQYLQRRQVGTMGNGGHECGCTITWLNQSSVLWCTLFHSHTYVQVLYTHILCHQLYTILPYTRTHTHTHTHMHARTHTHIHTHTHTHTHTHMHAHTHTHTHAHTHTHTHTHTHAVFHLVIQTTIEGQKRLSGTTVENSTPHLKGRVVCVALTSFPDLPTSMQFLIAYSMQKHAWDFLPRDRHMRHMLSHLYV